MSMENETQARGRWRLLERLGQGAGMVAGGAALALLWTYSLSTDAREALRAARVRKPLRPGSDEA